jgi:hypothetical protein
MAGLLLRSWSLMGRCSGCLAAGKKGNWEMVGDALFWLSGLD